MPAVIAPESATVLAEQMNEFLLDMHTAVYNLMLPQLVETFAFGLFTFLIIISSYTIVNKGLKTWANRIMLATTLTMYVVAAVKWALCFAIVWGDFATVLPETLVLGASNSTVAAGRSNLSKLIFASQVAIVINILLSDVVVLWRVCAIWLWDRRVMTLSGIFHLAVFVPFICVLIDNAEQILGVKIRGIELNAALRIVTPISLSIPLALNIWATGMIWYKARMHQRLLALDPRFKSQSVLSILVILVESGIGYCVLWAIYFASNYSALGTFGVCYQIIIAQLTGMYPVIVILLVARRTHGFVEKSWSNSAILGLSQDFLAATPPNSSLPLLMAISPTSPSTSRSFLAPAPPAPEVHVPPRRRME
ncbi:hypothetical protein PENSPDRAFT_659271 [Peniophora sp. CONT]|nr:hypothetical protein PENSPDRAFT_659271 [Peniophora sp. CONT]